MKLSELREELIDIEDYELAIMNAYKERPMKIQGVRFDHYLKTVIVEVR